MLCGERLPALDVPLAFLGAHCAQRDVQELTVRPVALTGRGQGSREPFRRRQDVLRVQRRSRGPFLHGSLLRGGGRLLKVGEEHGAGGGAPALCVGGGVGDAQQVAGDVADSGEPAVLESLA
ncbi:hypothetical protein SAMN05216511_7204 [Streptomyces sp. KS_16]|nr:hypothetical protein SAMN05216511_7204 [Streptomyces sp. KS_16]